MLVDFKPSTIFFFVKVQIVLEKKEYAKTGVIPKEEKGLSWLRKSLMLGTDYTPKPKVGGEKSKCTLEQAWENKKQMASWLDRAAYLDHWQDCLIQKKKAFADRAQGLQPYH